MKKSLSLIKFLGAGFLSLGAISISAAAINHNKNQNNKEVIAAGKDSYWSSWISANASTIEKGGKNFVTALKTKITQVQDGNDNIVGYDSLWAAYKTSDPVPGSNGSYIWDTYGGFKYTYQSGGKTSYGEEGAGYNREHSVPKSWFGSAKPAYSDLVHLLPTDGYVNAQRSNYTFGEVSSASYTYPYTAQSYGGVQYQNAGSSKLGSPKKINDVSPGVEKVFEPDDQYKGDFARIYMYFAVRYGGGDCQATKNEGSTIFTNTLTDDTPYMTNYGLALMQKWHVQDKVSEKEISRNNAIETLQNNRNPFVDYPEWADKIFGTNYSGDTPSTDPTITISPTSLTLTEGGSAGTITATIANGSGDVNWSSSNPSVVTVSGSGTNNTTCTVTPVAAGTATITASYSTATHVTCSVTVNSSGGGGGDSSTYELYSGSLTEGNYIIYYGGKAMKNTVSSDRLSYAEVTPNNDIIEDPDESIVWHIAPSGNYWTIYNEPVEQYAASTGTKNQAALSNSGTDDKSLWTVSGTSTYEFVNKYNASKSVNANLRENTTYGFACYSTGTGGALSLYKQGEGGGDDPTPSEKILSSIVLSGTYPTTFTQGDSFSHAGMVVTAKYTDSTTYPDADVSNSENLNFSGYNMSTTGQQTVTVTYTENNVEKSKTYTITVNAAPSPSDPQEGTGTINFGNGTGDVNVNSASVTGDDSLSNTWTITTTGTASFTPNADYSQIGSSKDPAESITFTTTLTATMKITAFSCKFGGFSGTAGTITMKVGTTTVATGSLNTTSDVTVTAATVQNTFPRMGTTLTITVTGISKGVKAYYISYKCQTWASNFLSLVTCNNGVTPPNSTNWKQTNTDYNALTQSEKNDVLAANPNQLGTKLEQAIARYVEVVNKYPNRTNYPDYLNKAVTSNRTFTPISSTSGLTIILIMLSITSTMIGFIFVGYYLKKKER